MTELELLSPARNLECAIAAIDHGADAVYIGAEQFGARAAAGNSMADIRYLCRYAHAYRVKVMVAVNTIVYDSELDSTRRLLSHLKEAHVDAVIAQDMAVFLMARELGLTVHASTQTDNRTADKVRWLQRMGATRVVLARELSVDEIRSIHSQVPDVELEVFVHGALCVSYSGLCYASQAFLKRSANRGVCSQFCRLSFDVVDSRGEMIEQGCHPLSLRDMSRIDYLEQLADAGAVSFKIEGRLKDVSYVKNVTAAYSQRLDSLVKRYPDRYCRSSLGRSTIGFTPDINRSFNRGFTDYYLSGRRTDVSSLHTPKAIGQPVGTVKEIRRGSLRVAGVCSFANGDGLCFLDCQRRLVGFRVNRAEGNLLFPLKMPAGIAVGMTLYRNNDQDFERQLSKSGSARKIPIVLSLLADEEGLVLTASVLSAPIRVEAHLSIALEQAEKSPLQNLITQLGKLGTTRYEASEIRIADGFSYFVPSSLLSQLRREMAEKLDSAIMEWVESDSEEPSQQTGETGMTMEVTSKESVIYAADSYYRRYPYLYNISNQMARQLYRSQHLKSVSMAYELQPSVDGVLMQCRHCLRYTLGHCVKHGGRPAGWKEPLYLVAGDGRRFRLEFDCARCQMNVYAG